MGDRGELGRLVATPSSSGIIGKFQEMEISLRGEGLSLSPCALRFQSEFHAHLGITLIAWDSQNMSSQNDHGVEIKDFIMHASLFIIPVLFSRNN